MEGAGDPESSGDTDVAGDGVESGDAVEIEILAGVEDIESGDPEGDGGGEEQDARVERTADGDPGGGRGDTECEAQHQVRETREALGVGVEQQHGKRDRGKPEGEAIQLRGSEDEDDAGD